MNALAKQSKRNEDVPEPAPITGAPGGVVKGNKAEEKVTEAVKLRPTFKYRLQRVAQKAGLDMGILIERQMEDFINREYATIVEQELKELRGG